jgi:hypothetical protein
MSRAEECRRYARQCLEIAPTFQDEEARATLLGFAEAWLRLAHVALDRQIAAYDAIKADVEPKSLGKWDVVYDRQLIGTYDSFDAAAKEAVRIATAGAYLQSHVVKPKRSATTRAATAAVWSRRYL